MPHNPTWQAASAELYGEIELGEGVSIWPKVVMRAEINHIGIGSYTNIQDFAMIHINSAPTIIGEYCSITHHCTIHGAKIGNNCLIGINATIMDGANIGANSIVAGHTIVKEGTVIPENSIVAGVPGKVVATKNNYVANRVHAMAYFENALAYAIGNHRRWSENDYQEKIESWQATFQSELANTKSAN